MTADRADGRSWLAWPLVALSALPVAAVALVARRVLTGETGLFGDVPRDLPFRERAGLLLNISQPESQLLLPLIGLALLAWLVRVEVRRSPPRGALWAGAVVAAAAGALALGQCALIGYLVVSDAPEDDQGFFFGESLLELFGPRAASGALLAVLAGGVVVALVTAARRPEPAEVVLPGEDEQTTPASDDEPHSVQAVVLQEPPGDPHARFRRP